MNTPDEPPFTLTPRVLALVTEIGEALGRIIRPQGVPTLLALRRGNRLRTIPPVRRALEGREKCLTRLRWRGLQSVGRTSRAHTGAQRP